VGAVALRLLCGQRVGGLIGERRLQALLVAHLETLVRATEAAERLRLEVGLQLLRRDVAVGHEDGVRRMVVVAVEGDQLRVGQVGDRLGVAAAVPVVGGGREQPLAQRVPERPHRGAHRPLHLVEHHPLVDQWAVRRRGVVELDTMPLLGKIELIKLREKCCI
jgi:hypothetical protein